MPGAFIRKIPTTANTLIPCDIVEGTLDDARNWDTLVQPHCQLAPGFQPEVDWKWPSIVRQTQFTEFILGRNCAYFQLTTFAGGARIPLGQLLLSVGYDYLPDTRQSCIYLWYLAAAPESFLKTYHLPKVKILRPMIDTAIQFSLLNGYDGRVCLHALPCKDPQYHAELFAKYVSLGLTPLPADHQIRKITKRNDGRYLYCDNNSWLGISSPLDYCRK